MLYVIFMVFLLSLAALVWALSAKDIPLDKTITVITTLVNTIISALALAIKWKSENQAAISPAKKRSAKTKPFRVAPSFKSGFVGALIGGGLAGLVTGVSYYLSGRHPPLPTFQPVTPDSILWIFSFACVSGAVFGCLSQFFILGLRHLFKNFVISDVVGGLLGGGLAGTILGFWAALLFGENKTPPTNPYLLFAGGVFCAICIVLGTLLYDRKERGRKVKPTLIILLLVTFVVGTLGVYLLMVGGFDDKYFEIQNDRTLLTERGAKLGGLIGTLWGLILGLTLLFSRITSELKAVREVG
jgi:hypothetical protein